MELTRDSAEYGAPGAGRRRRQRTQRKWRDRMTTADRARGPYPTRRRSASAGCCSPSGPSSARPLHDVVIRCCW